MEAYIGKCLDSLLIPEFDAVEVLVVNDGSRDRSSEIAHSYADRYPASIRVIDKPNGNYGSCINAALPLATGRYVKVLDADDTFDTTAFSRFVQMLPDIDDDAVITSYTTIDEAGHESGRLDVNKWELPLGQSLSTAHAFPVIEQHFIQMHMIAYKSVLFSRFDYHQTEGISYTDTEWAIIPMAFCKSFRFLNLSVYRYLTGRTGQTMSDIQFAKNFNHLLEVITNLTINYQKSQFDKEISEHIFRKTVRHHIYAYSKALNLNNKKVMEELMQYDANLKVKYPRIYSAIDNYFEKGAPFRFIHEMRIQNFPSTLKFTLLQRVKFQIKRLIACSAIS